MAPELATLFRSWWGWEVPGSAFLRFSSHVLDQKPFQIQKSVGEKHFPCQHEDPSPIPAPLWKIAKCVGMCLETGGSRGACQPAILAKRDPEEQHWGWSQGSAGTCRHEHTGACSWVLKVWSQLSGKMPANARARYHSPLSLHGSGTKELPLSSSCGSLFPLLWFRLPLLCFASPPHPHPASLLFSYLFSILYFALTQPLIPDWFKRPHPGSPAEQGCSVHILYPVAGCHLKVIADTSQTLLSEATARDSISK